MSARRAFPDVPVPQLTAALDQAGLRAKGGRMRLLTDSGLQQATATLVATARARRLSDSGVRDVIDAGCGIGSDSLAFARAGLRVTAFESDERTADIARCNLTGHNARVITADVTSADLPPGAALYADPARRAAHRYPDGQPVRIGDPARWSPPWPWVLAQTAVRPTVARTAPGLRDRPDGEWHCTSVDRRLVDATVWFGDLAAADRRATVIAEGAEHELTGSSRQAATGPIADYLIDPDPAIVRSGLVVHAADIASGLLLDEHVAYITCRAMPPAWLGRAFRVLEEVSVHPKHLRAACQRLGVRTLTVTSRGLDGDPQRLLVRAGIATGADATLIVTRIGRPKRHTVAFLARPVREDHRAPARD